MSNSTIELFIAEYRDAGNSAIALQQRGLSSRVLTQIANDTALHPEIRDGLLAVYDVKIRASATNDLADNLSDDYNDMLNRRPLSLDWMKSVNEWKEILNTKDDSSPNVNGDQAVSSHQTDSGDVDMDESESRVEDEARPAKRRRPNDLNTDSTSPQWESLPPDVVELIRRYAVRNGDSTRRPWGLAQASKQVWHQYQDRVQRSRDRITVGSRTNLLPTRIHLGLVMFMAKLMRNIRTPRYDLSSIVAEEELGVKNLGYDKGYTIVDWRIESALNNYADVSLVLVQRVGQKIYTRPMATMDLTSPEVDRLCIRADQWAFVEKSFDTGKTPHFGQYHTATSLPITSTQLIDIMGHEKVIGYLPPNKTHSVSLPWSGKPFKVVAVGNDANNEKISKGDDDFSETPCGELAETLYNAEWSCDMLLYDIRLESPNEYLYKKTQRRMFGASLSLLQQGRHWLFQSGVLLSRACLTPNTRTYNDGVLPRTSDPLSVASAIAILLDRSYPITSSENLLKLGDFNRDSWAHVLRFPIIKNPVKLDLSVVGDEDDYKRLGTTPSRDIPFSIMLHGKAKVFKESDVVQSILLGPPDIPFVSMPPETYSAQFIRSVEERLGIQRTATLSLQKLDALLDHLCSHVLPFPIDSRLNDLKIRLKRDLSSCFSVQLQPERLSWADHLGSHLLAEYEFEHMWLANTCEPDSMIYLDHPELLPRTSLFVNEMLLEVAANVFEHRQPSNVISVDIHFCLEKFAQLITQFYTVDEEQQLEHAFGFALEEWKREEIARQDAIYNLQVEHIKRVEEHEKSVMKKNKSWWDRIWKGKEGASTVATPNKQEKPHKLDRYIMHRGEKQHVPLAQDVLATPGFYTFTIGDHLIEIPNDNLKAYKFKFIERLGAGYSGVTYHICMRGKCNRAIKIGSIEDREVETCYFMGEIGIGPKVYLNFDVQPANEPPTPIRALVMKRVDMTLEMWLESGQTLTENHAESLYRLLRRAWEQKFVHGDLKPDNVGINIKRQGDDFVITRFYLIDFGTSYFQQVDGEYDPLKRRGGWLRTVPFIVDFRNSYERHSLLGTFWDHLCLLYYLQRFMDSVKYDGFVRRFADLAFNHWRVNKSFDAVMEEMREAQRRATQNTDTNPFLHMHLYMSGLSRTQVRRL